MRTAIHLNDKILPNPTRKTISSILKHTPADYEMSKYLIKSRLDPRVLNALKTLNKHKIKYLLIGGFAAVLYGVPRSTFDIDIAISLDSKNIGDTITLLSGLGFSQIPEEESHIEQPRFDIIYEYHTKLSYKGTIIKLPNIMDCEHQRIIAS